MVNYEGRLQDGTIFDSSYDREALKVNIGVGQVIKGWDIGIMSMKLGEKAELTISPEFAYGAAGSPPTIPPNATLIFTVELIQISDRRPTRWMMSDMELVAAAKKLKDDGAARFKAGEFKAAEGHYRDALAHADTVKNKTDELTNLLQILNQNIALMCIKTQGWKEAERHCTAALALNPEAEKALYYRAQCRDHLKLFDGAIEDIKAVIKLKPNEKAYRAEFDKYKEHKKKAGAAEGEMMKKMFAKGMYSEKDDVK